MKKISLTLSMILVVIMIVACGKSMAGSPYIGKWVATSAEMEGISIDIGTIMDGDFSFELKEDGTCVATIGTEQESGKWEESDTGFVVEGEFEAVVDGDTAVIDYDGLKMNMEKA